MRKAFRGVALFAISVVVGCSSPTEPTRPELTILNPRGGETFKLGDPVTIRWRCTACERVSTSAVSVELSWELGGGQFTTRHITVGLVSGDYEWRAGYVGDGNSKFSVEPGVYQLRVSDYPPPNPGPGQTGTYELYGSSRAFLLTR